MMGRSAMGCKRGSLFFLCRVEGMLAAENQGQAADVAGLFQIC